MANINLTDTNKIWEKITDKLLISISTVSYHVYFKNLYPYTIMDNKLIIVAPLPYIKKAITENWRKLMLQVFKELHEESYSVPFNDFVVILEDEKDNFAPLESEAQSDVVELGDSLSFIKEYTFSNFVIGDSNKLAAMACMAVAEQPGDIYNPLFIHSRPGLGKTHLLNAIGNYLRDKKKDWDVMYVTAENFTNDFIYSIRNNKNADFMKSFNNKYRNKDVLMIDDVQFLEKAEKTQEALFYIFNDLYSKHKQIIISSDRPIKNLSFFDERLTSRFASGIVVDITSPSFEDRVAILLHKASQYNFNISEKVLYYIAGLEQNNIRVLEGMLKTVGIYSRLTMKPVDSIEFVQEALKSHTTNENVLTNQVITEAAADYFGVKIEDVLGPRRTKNVIQPRQFAIYLITQMIPNQPLSSMEEYFNRDHATIISARDKIGRLYMSDEETKRIVDDIRNGILNK